MFESGPSCFSFKRWNQARSGSSRDHTGVNLHRPTRRFCISARCLGLSAAAVDGRPVSAAAVDGRPVSGGTATDSRALPAVDGRGAVAAPGPNASKSSVAHDTDVRGLAASRVVLGRARSFQSDRACAVHIPEILGIAAQVEVVGKFKRGSSYYCFKCRNQALLIERVARDKISEQHAPALIQARYRQ